ncbi:SDR family oxidoreductase [Kineococcus aurantiacus]|uniref:NAD(P)-dependent dehydrogenase (Short-subunit alcohol dehydrogenase family) n=1 Tax=Kineococcus aurantiacus TaxID=37633 RepID=A0A7Y9AR73_9ACTN|nr:SDR family oxidoreductase [Kineococcus aurantiacus]NYD20493.1 NAD(P)-dependent dehydrogenase (short-subunit alcohol dehydrogenase family) [Kineococcus aurantiacus]
MELEGATALVTGANRGLGRRLSEELLARGARVYAAARDPRSIDLPGVTPLALDITDPAAVAAAVQSAPDVTVLVNNAGSATGASALTGDLADVRLEMETHYFGTLSMIRAFAPRIEANGGGTVLNILSALSWLSYPGVGAYSAAKSASWSLTNAVRQELAPRGVHVAGLHVGYMDTDMAAGVDGPKVDPREVARAAVDGIAADAWEILADTVSRQVQQGLSGGVPALYPDLAR